MKQGTLITKIVMFVLFAGVIIYLAVYAAVNLSDSLVTTIAYQDVLDDCVEVSGILVREEVVLSSGAAIMDVLPEEGERVAAHETVAILYQNSEALDRKKQLQALETQKLQLQYALSSGSSLEDAARLESQIFSSILTLRASGSDLSNLETDAQALRTQVLQREFAYSATGDSAAALSETIASLDYQIVQLQTQVSYNTTSVYAPCSGIFSGLVDGWEGVLTPTVLETISAGQLADAVHGTSSPEGAHMGKLITSDRWYFAAVVEPSVADRLQPGNWITAAFSRDFTGDVSMRVERVGAPEAEGCVLVLSSTRNLKDITLLRDQTVSLVFQRYTGIRVPKQALRMETLTTIDPDTEEEIHTQALCVYAVVGGLAERRLVKVVREGGDYYLVSPAVSSGTKRLRAGDEIIVLASGLYDGKVVRK